jgi:polyphosphate kinase
MQTPPRTPEIRRRGANGRFLPRGTDSSYAQSNGTQSNGTEHNGTQHNSTQRTGTQSIGAVNNGAVRDGTEDGAEQSTAAATDRLDPRADDPTATEHAMSDRTEIIESDDSAEYEEPPASPELPEDRFLNRELSWLDFNARVLALAEDPGTPLLERAKFLAIFAGNLDEFFMVRVAGLKRRLSAGLPMRGGDRVSLRSQLEMITERTADLVTRHAACFAEEVRPKLSAEGIEMVSWGELDAPERERLRTYFRDKVFPVLTPLAVDPAHPFPYISSRSLNLAVVLRDPDGRDSELFARVKVPNNVPRFVTVQNDSRGARFLPVEELIAVHLDQLFSGMQILEWHLFRVTRNAELEVDEDRDEDLLQALERELAQRRFGPPVRLEVAASISDHVLDLLVRELDMDSQDVLRVPGLLDLSALWQVFGECDRDDLKDRPFVPATHPQLADGEVPRSVFNRLRERDILVHHPYHSFSTSVQRFIEQAAADPQTRTCWRSSRRCTAPPATRRSWTRSSTRPRPASRWSCS